MISPVSPNKCEVSYSGGTRVKRAARRGFNCKDKGASSQMTRVGLIAAPRLEAET
jgi:hypothetical protein